MRADDLLIADHGEIRALLHQLEQSRPEDATQRSALLDTLLGVLDVHVQIENDLYYPAVRDVSPLYAIAHTEHRQIDDQLAVVFRTDPTSEEFHTEVAMLAATVEHHASEEEQEMFPHAEALGPTGVGNPRPRHETAPTAPARLRGDPDTATDQTRSPAAPVTPTLTAAGKSSRPSGAAPPTPRRGDTRGAQGGAAQNAMKSRPVSPARTWVVADRGQPGQGLRPYRTPPDPGAW